MKNILLFTLLFVNIFLGAQSHNVPPAPTSVPGGSGGDGFGQPASPIDMYVYILIAVGIIMMAYYAKRLQKQNA